MATTQAKSTNWTAGAVVVALYWCIGGTIGDELGLAVWAWPLLGLGALVITVTVAAVSERAMQIFFVVVTLVAITLALNARWLLLLVVPIVFVLAVALLTRSVHIRSARDAAVAVAAITRSAPLLAPLALVVLFIPALSEDVWDVAAQFDVTRLVLLGVATVGLLVYLVSRQLRRELPLVLATRAKRLAADADRGEATRTGLQRLLDDNAFQLVNRSSGQFALESWPTDAVQYTDLIAACEQKALSRPLMSRLLLCVAFIAVALVVYLFVLLAIVVDPAVAAQWTGARVPVSNLDLLGLTVEIPRGIYFKMSGLLGCLAVATFLSFVVIEERFTTALGDALLRIPIDRLLVLALPFLHLRELMIVDGDPLPDDFDVSAVVGD